MKIGFDVSPIIYGTGVSNYIHDLVNHLPEQNLVLFGSSFRRQSDIQNIFPRCKTFPFPPTFLDLLWNRLHVLPVESLIGQIDIFHSSDWVQPPSKAKKVTTVHDLSPFLYPQELDPKIVAVHARRMYWVVKECDAIICVSQNTAQDMRRLFPETSSRLVIIPEALPSHLLLKSEKLNLGKYVVTIGARQPRKNIARLKEACKLLGQKLIIIGEGGDLGHVSDQELVNYLSNASVFVYPSIYEGFGLPILEAFHFKVPVACSNTSSLPEVAGEAAAYFDPLSEKSIAEGIVQASQDRAKLIVAGTRQLSKFSWEKTVQKTMEVYKSLL